MQNFCPVLGRVPRPDTSLFCATRFGVICGPTDTGWDPDGEARPKLQSLAESLAGLPKVLPSDRILFTGVRFTNIQNDSAARKDIAAQIAERSLPKGGQFCRSRGA